MTAALARVPVPGYAVLVARISRSHGTNGIYVTGQLGQGAADATWIWAPNPGFPAVVDQVTVTGDDRLELPAGAVVKF